MRYCAWCDCELNSFYLRYRGKTFCRTNDDACIKNYLFEEADKEIEEDRDETDDYTMDYVLWMEERGLD